MTMGDVLHSSIAGLAILKIPHDCDITHLSFVKKNGGDIQYYLLWYDFLCNGMCFL